MSHFSELAASISSGDLDIVSALGSKGLCHIVCNIFQDFGGQSLLNARLVCKVWNEHIKKHVYGSAEGRRNMVALFEKNWKKGICAKQVVPIKVFDKVADIKVDEE